MTPLTHGLWRQNLTETVERGARDLECGGLTPLLDGTAGGCTIRIANGSQLWGAISGELYRVVREDGVPTRGPIQERCQATALQIVAASLHRFREFEDAVYESQITPPMLPVSAAPTRCRCRRSL